jgi:carboxyl-terminal processing protease
MQDYKRGVIFGSPHTFGKGTVQQIIDLDQTVSYQYSNYKPLGSVKLTTQKFYRINGGATQLRGVQSDIVAPDVYKYIKYGEKELENTLAWDQIAPANYRVYASGNPFEKAINNSRYRIARSDFFALTERSAQRLKTRQDEQNYTLNIFQYVKELQQNDVEDKKLRDASNAIAKISIKSFPEEFVDKSDTLSIARTKKFNDDVAKDPYILEAMRITQDL